jgi:hypothetical protein
MGMSWVIDGSLRAKSKDALGTIDPAAFDDWPEDFEPSGEKVSAKKLLARLAKEPRAEVAWKGSTLTVRAILVNDGSLWADHRVHLIALFRAHDGELLVGPASDNSTGVALSVAARKCTVLRGKKLDAADKKLRAVEDALPTGAPRFVVDAALAPVHRKILERLRALAEKELLAAAAKHPVELSPRAEKRDYKLSKLYADRASLLSALERGDPKLVDWHQVELLKASLAILAHASPNEARALAGEVLASGTKTVAMTDLALTLTADYADLDLRPLRASLPVQPFYGVAGVIAANPMVKELSRKNESRAAVSAALAKTVGKPEKWKKLSGRDICFALALALVLRAHKSAADRPLLSSLKSHPEAVLNAI